MEGCNAAFLKNENEQMQLHRYRDDDDDDGLLELTLFSLFAALLL